MSEAFSYDQVLYLNHPFAQTHPDRLATIARLFGMNPAPADRCRVLELGTGDGTNILPLAHAFPNSTFLGLDLSEVAIGQGQVYVDELQLENIKLQHLDLLDVTPALGEFDYILCHGLYSWVPPLVRDKILEICRQNLAPQGVAYVSYNALPGCHVRRMMWEMMQFHVRGETTPEGKIQQAQQFLKFLAAGQTIDNGVARTIREEAESLDDKNGTVLYHDDLSEINAPVYFHQFASHAAQHDLQYLGEAVFSDMQDYLFPEPILEVLRQLESNVLQKEQYMDFLKGRRFRQTLLCHSEVALDRKPGRELMREFHSVSPATPVSENPSLEPGVAEEFKGKRESRLKTDDPYVKASLVVLNESFPSPIAFDELVSRALAKLSTDTQAEGAAEAADEIADALLHSYAAGLVELYRTPPPIANAVSERPTTTPFIRWQAARGTWITNLRHEPVEVEDPLARRLLTLLDGHRTVADLEREMSAYIRNSFRNQPERIDKFLSKMASDLPTSLKGLIKIGVLRV